jgi:predicted HicB family RNase H-like nuclease
MQTMLELNDDLLNQAKLFAEQKHTTLNSLVEDALSRYMQFLPTKTSSTVLPVYHGEGGLSVAVNNSLTNRALLDAADQDVAISL